MDRSSNLIALVNLTDSPVAEDPGALTRDEVVNNPRQANQRNASFNSVNRSIYRSLVSFTAKALMKAVS